MKYIIMLGDGMSDYPLESLNQKTPLEVAKKPNIDSLVKGGIIGLAKTVPDNMKPGSDVANLAVMGYNPQDCYTGRSPLEAVSIGIKMSETDVAIRCNLVTLSDETDYNAKTMLDYCSDEISTEEADELIKAVSEALGTEQIKFFTGISYRHCMIWDKGEVGLDLAPPHDISDRKILEYLPKNPMILELMQKSHDVLKNHPVNIERVKKGKNPANSIWLWGEGTKPSVANFKEKTGLNGAVISAVDLIKGIGLCADMDVIEVEGATGNIDTNFKGKCKAAIDTLLGGNDFVYIHVEAPDECGHRGELENKIHAIELIDSEIVGPLLKALEEANEDYSILVCPDHPTPIALKTHVSDPVPFIIYRSNDIKNNEFDKYTEEFAKQSGVYLEDGYKLLDKLINN